MPNLYLEAAYGDWKFKFGHFASPVGYFALQTNLNFFNTLPYTFQYGEPFTHTGIVATKTVSDSLTVFGGVTRGWDNFGSLNPHLGFIGGLTKTFESGASFAMVNVWSEEPNSVAPLSFSSRYLQTNVLTVPLTEELQYVNQVDFATQAAGAGPGTNSAEWYGVNQYLIYTINDCWAWGLGFEWFRDDDGVRVGALLPTIPGGGSPNARGQTLPFGFAGNFYQTTFGPRWTPNANTMVRLNGRYDSYDGINPGGAAPYNDAAKNQQWLFVTDVTFSF